MMLAAARPGSIHLSLLLIQMLDQSIAAKHPAGHGSGVRRGMGANRFSIWPRLRADIATAVSDRGVAVSGQGAFVWSRPNKRSGLVRGKFWVFQPPSAACTRCCWSVPSIRALHSPGSSRWESGWLVQPPCRRQSIELAA